MLPVPQSPPGTCSAAVDFLSALHRSTLFHCFHLQTLLSVVPSSLSSSQGGVILGNLANEKPAVTTVI